MLDVSFSWRWLGAVVGALAGCVLVLFVVLIGILLFGGPVSDCPPLGNGGAIHVGQPVDAVSNESEAVAAVRAHLQNRGAATTTDSPTATNATMTTTLAPNATASATANGSTTATRTLSVGGHFHGSEQVHGGVSRDGGVPEHYHVDVDDGGSTIGNVVTADGELYRVVYGDC